MAREDVENGNDDEDGRAEREGGAWRVGVGWTGYRCGEFGVEGVSDRQYGDCAGGLVGMFVIGLEFVRLVCISHFRLLQ